MLGGYGEGSSAYVNGLGYYWSSTYYSTSYAYRLYFNSGGVNSQEPGYKYNGYAVRCVKNLELKSERGGRGRRVAVFTETVRDGSEFSSPPEGVLKWRSEGKF